MSLLEIMPDGKILVGDQTTVIKDPDGRLRFFKSAETRPLSTTMKKTLASSLTNKEVGDFILRQLQDGKQHSTTEVFQAFEQAFAFTPRDRELDGKNGGGIARWKHQVHSVATKLRVQKKIRCLDRAIWSLA